MTSRKHSPRGLELDLHELQMLSLLALVEARPGMYMGPLAEDPNTRLDALTLLISGYQFGVRRHGLEDHGDLVYGHFIQSLADQGWSMAAGPIGAVRTLHPDPENAWTAFWELLWNFVSEWQHSLHPKTSD